MRRALTYARDFGAVIAHETQDPDLASYGVMNEGLFASWLGLPGIPREAELITLERDLSLARLTGGAYHAAKLSTAMSAAACRAKSDGADVTAGVSINNLALNEMMSANTAPSSASPRRCGPRRTGWRWSRR
jgi:dihydroorotase